MRQMGKWVWQRLMRYFLSGVFCLLPVVITVAVVAWVAGLLTTYFGPGTTLGRWLSGLGLKLLPDSAAPYVLGWIVVLLVVFAVGVVAELGAKSLIRGLMERFFKRMPLVGGIYTTSKQVVEMLDQSDATALQGMTAVFCHFGEQGRSTAMLAFLVSPRKYQLDGGEYQIVIVPTAPLPFGGAMLFVPADHIRPANMPIEGLMNMYVSMGVTAPDYLEQGVGPSGG